MKQLYLRSYGAQGVQEKCFAPLLRFATFLLALLLLCGCSADKAERYYQEALALADEGDAPQALERFRMAADHARADTLLVAIHSEMGHLLFEEGLQEDALVAFRKAYEVDCRLGDTLGIRDDER